MPSLAAHGLGAMASEYGGKKVNIIVVKEQRSCSVAILTSLNSKTAVQKHEYNHVCVSHPVAVWMDGRPEGQKVVCWFSGPQ